MRELLLPTELRVRIKPLVLLLVAVPRGNPDALELQRRGEHCLGLKTWAFCQIRTDVFRRNWVTNPVQSSTMRRRRGEGQVVYTFEGLPQTFWACRWTWTTDFRCIGTLSLSYTGIINHKTHGDSNPHLNYSFVTLPKKSTLIANSVLFQHVSYNLSR